MKLLRKLRYVHKGVTAFILSALILDMLGVTFLTGVLSAPAAEAAVVTIDSTANADNRSFNYTGAQTVFVSDVVGYNFYRDSTGQCVYSKSTDSGDSWGSPVIVDSQTDCIRIVVWYDQWTPGDTGTNIHITTMDTGSDALFYNRLDTSSDALLLGSSPVNATSNSGQSPSFTSLNNTHTITKATDGEVYLSSADNSDAYVVSCDVTCQTGANWNEVGSNPLDARNDHSLLVPLADDDVMLINRDTSANRLRSKVWNGVSWSGSWVTIDSSTAESFEYAGGLSATVDLATGYIYLAYVNDNDVLTDNNDDIRTAIYDGSAWTSMADVLTNVSGRGILDVAIAMDQNNGDVYVAYTIQDTAGTVSSANVYYKESTDAMTAWGVEEGPVNSTPGDIRKPGLDPGNLDRLYVTWWESSVRDQFGETLDNIGPDSTLTTLGTHLTSVRSETTSNYLGGAFVINSLTSNSVSSVTISESGTIDAATGLDNIELYYDLDITAPYDCSSESYAGVEAQFGATDTNGFDAANGQATFTGSVVGVSPTQAICLYVVSDVTSAASDGATVVYEVTDPPLDIEVSGADIAPASTVTLPGATTIVSPQLTQTHYHWRNDDGSESTATSDTGGVEDTPLPALSVENPRRLRMGVSVEGSTSTQAIAYQLEYATAAPTCTDVTSWVAVDAADDAFNMSPSANLTDGADTTDIAEATGGLTNENTTFVTSNGGVQDTGDITSAITLQADEYLELEFSIVASTTAIEGETYCFRLSNAGADLGIYDVYAQATINAEVSVADVGTQVTSVDIPTVGQYLGGGFAVVANDAAQTVSTITISEFGTVDATSGLDNIELYYDLDTTAPYDCSSESYNGTETQFGATDTDGFDSADGSATFTGTVPIDTTQSMCVYVVSDITGSAVDGETIELSIANPKTDVVAGTASVSPSSPQVITGATTLLGSVVTQTHYHWRNDNGSEAGATSASGGNEDTSLEDFQLTAPIRLRAALSNEGATSSDQTAYQLEFAEQVTTCSAIASWTPIDAVSEDDWDMFDSPNLTHGAETTNITESAGGTSDENTQFQDPNSGIRETVGRSATTTLTQNEFVEYEFSITSTLATAFDTTYCFRLTADGVSLPVYSSYPEITMASKRDFRIQRGTLNLSGLSQTITAGIDYIAPATSSAAFIRITNTNYTGAGDITAGGAQDVQETTAYIQNPENIASSITFARDLNLAETFIDWEIVEFIGQADTDNEMLVQANDTISMTGGETSVTGSTVNVEDDADVVVFITGVSGDDSSNDFYATQVTAEWDAINDQPIFTRAATGFSAVAISYAVVEFSGINWNVQRVEHTYSAAGVPETESISPVSSLSQAFVHAQKRVGANSFVGSLGHEVFLSSIGVVTFELEASANLTVPHVSVAWVVENTQTGIGAMQVERQSGSTQLGSEPLSLSISIADPLDAVNNSSILGNSSAAGTNNAHPRSIAGLRITSPTTYQLWRSDTGSRLYYRTEIVQWPVADLAIRQNYYRLYTDNNLVTPDDPWPEGAADLGENTSITTADNPPGIGERVRIRMTLRAKNANWPAEFYQFKLQYAERVSTCTAVGTWTDVGAAASGEIWRGFAATGTADGTDLSGDPPTPGDLLLSVADVAGTLEHQNLSATNTYIAYNGEDVEYDWYVEHNGAAAGTTYCFRAVEPDGTALSGYLQYPQIRTADFTPRITDWRWYDDAENETPTAPLAPLNSTPSEISASTTLALRVVVDEQKSVNGEDVKFRLQFSEDITFSDPINVAPTSSCRNGSLWCFYDGGGVNNATITTAVTGASDPCIASVGGGCGTHNSDGVYATGRNHPAEALQEYSFMVQSTLLRAGAVYYFRLYDIAAAEPVELASGSSYPAAVGEGAGLVFTVSGLPSGTTTADVTTGVTTTPSSIDFGVLPVGNDQVAAQRLQVNTNATEGYQIWKYSSQELTNAGGVVIDNVTSTNAAPGGWSSVCQLSASSCAGYHTTDATLVDGSTRFAAVDTYAPLHTSVEEIIYSSLPADESHDVVYRVQVRENQPAGDYTTSIVYIATPVF